jgi:hypothetical protein
LGEFVSTANYWSGVVVVAAGVRMSSLATLAIITLEVVAEVIRGYTVDRNTVKVVEVTRQLSSSPITT